jgi:hypothetical protein
MAESVATNNLGNSSSVQGAGPIDMFDTKLGKKDSLFGLMKRKQGKPLRSIVTDATNREMSDDLKKDRRRGI